MIRTWLEQAEGGQLAAQDAALLARALGGCWCWPPDEEGRRRATEFAADRKLGRAGAPQVGEVCLVSVAQGGRAALWALEAPRPGARVARFVNEASESLRRAWIVASRELPICAAPEAPRDLPVARLLARVGSGRDEVLDGTSFGLAFVLAAASRILRRPVPRDVLASALVDRDGCVHPVDPIGLQRKIELVVSHAPGVRRLLVADHPVEPDAPTQAEASRDFLQTVGAAAGGLEIVGVRDVRHALREVFPVVDGVADHWDTDHEAATVAREIIRATLLNAPGVFGWRGIAAAADRLLRRFDGRPFPSSVRCLVEVPRGLEIARAIALRHDGRKAALSWPETQELRELARPVRLELVAHLVQSAADADDDGGLAFAARALEHVGAPAERHAEDLKVLGAMGRAHAAAGRLEDASRLLHEAREGWFRLGRASDASYAWCELVRVEALRGEVGAVTSLLADLDEIAGGQLVPAGYLHLAAGRALTLLGRHEDALAHHLGPAALEWDLTPDHVRLAVLRWRAVASTALGRREDARAARAAIAASCRIEDGAIVEDDYLCLARLDDAIERGDERDAVAHLASLRGLPHVGFESARLESRLRAELGDDAPALELARELARAYRY